MAPTYKGPHKWFKVVSSRTTKSSDRDGVTIKYIYNDALVVNEVYRPSGPPPWEEITKAEALAMLIVGDE